jgi:hypothetical protein
VKVRAVGGHLDRPGMVALDLDHLTTRHDVCAGDPRPPRRQHVLAITRRVGERLRQRLHRQGRERLVDPGGGRKGRVVEAADPVAHGSPGAEPMRRRIGADGLAVADPDLVVAGGPAPRLAGRHAGMADVPERDVEGHDVLATGAERALLDPHPQRGEPQLGVSHVGEELADAGHAGGKRGKLRPAALAGCHGQRRGAVPQACRCHRGIVAAPGGGPAEPVRRLTSGVSQPRDLRPTRARSCGLGRAARRAGPG